MNIKLKAEHLLAELDDVLRTMPARSAFDQNPESTLPWLGRASAAIHAWDPIRSGLFSSKVSSVHNVISHISDDGYYGLVTMLHQASHELRMSSVGPLTVAVAQGRSFDYFDEVRKVVEQAKVDLLFVDPYLDAEFVSRYFPHITSGISVRLLTRERIGQLMPAVLLMRQQSGMSIEVRSAAGFHDRYVFVDRTSCFHSGASFKDGAKKAPTTLTQVVDAFAAVSATYEGIWTTAKVE